MTDSVIVSKRRLMEEILSEINLYCSDLGKDYQNDFYEAIYDCVNKYFPNPPARDFQCPHCDYCPGSHTWSALVLTRHLFKEHGIPGVARHNNTRFIYAKVSWKERLKILFTGNLEYRHTTPKSST